LRGRAGYQRALAETIPHFTPFEGRVSVDGDVVAAGPLLLVYACGGQIRARSFELLPDSMLDDGLLDVCVLAGSGDPMELARAAAARLRSHPSATFGRGTRVTVERLDGDPLVFEHDGAVAAERLTAIELSVIPGVVAMLVPEPPAASLSPYGVDVLACRPLTWTLSDRADAHLWHQ
jgi:diacylglycerol kinase (ATP)